MSVPGKNLTKCTLLVQSSPQARIDYDTMLSLPTSFIKQSMQERDRETQIDRWYYQAFFYERKTKYL